MFVIFKRHDDGSRIAIPVGSITQVCELKEDTLEGVTELTLNDSTLCLIQHSFDQVGTLITSAIAGRYDRSPLLSRDSDEIVFLQNLKKLLKEGRPGEALDLLDTVIITTSETQGEEENDRSTTTDTDTAD